MAINDDVQNNLYTLVSDLIGIESDLASFILSSLQFLRYDVEKTLEAYGDSMTNREAAQAIDKIDKLTDKAYNAIEKGLITRLADVGSFSQDRLISVFDNLQVSLGTPIFTDADLRALASNIMIEGAPMKDWWANQSTNAQMKFAQQIRMGMAANETIPQLVNRIVGSPTGRRRAVTVNGTTRVIKERVGGIMDVTRNWADSLVRTATQAVNNQALYQTYQANGDVLRGTQALVTLDFRTSPICQPRQGWAWDLVTGKPIKTYNTATIDFPGPPPWHFRCRTVLMPIVKSWAELGSKTKEKDYSSKVRASMDGQVASKLTYEQWLRQQERSKPGVAENVLGATKYKLWKDGASVNDFVNSLGVPKSVAELRKEYGL